MRIVVLLLLFTVSGELFSQNKYWVFFKDKKGSTFNPYEYFDPLAIQRRLQLGINLYDSTDFPVSEEYINQVTSLADSVSWSTRWFNAIAVYADENKINAISALPFVKSISLMWVNTQVSSYTSNVDEIDPLNEKIDLLKGQIRSLQGGFFINNKYDGKGVRIAILDAGFKYANTCDQLDKVFLRKGVVGTFDFFKKTENVYKFDTHGTQVFCCLAGMYDSLNVGLATGAEYLLARTEDARTETRQDEEYWLAGLEWADRKGAKIISSSLGHAWWFYFTQDMNGKTSLVSKAANMAARKGMLVVTAAGNEGSNRNWKYILTPADADSALTVGGIDHQTGLHMYFSSYGPTADGRMKPNVCAYARVLSFDFEDVIVDGTSFACPLVAGFAACVWQMNPQLTNMQLFKEIEKSSTLYPYFDYAHGFGVPQASFFFDKTAVIADTTFDFSSNTNKIEIVVREKYINDKCDKPAVMYGHIEDENGKLITYYVWEVKEKLIETFNTFYSEFYEDKLKGRLKTNQKLVIYYKGFVNSITVK